MTKSKFRVVLWGLTLLTMPCRGEEILLGSTIFSEYLVGLTNFSEYFVGVEYLFCEISTLKNF